MRNGPDEPAFYRSEEAPGWFWPTLGIAVVLSIPYYCSLKTSFPYFSSLETFFSHDDFAILWFHKDWSIYKPWAFFNTDVLTFYRPMQSYAMAVLFHFFGTTPFPYGLGLVAIHVATIVLFGRLVDRLFRDRSLTFLSVIFYAANWESLEVVTWKGNYGTAFSWLYTLGACNAFLSYLRRSGLRSYILAFALTICALLSKETAINAPLLFTLIYGMCLWRPRDRGAPGLRISEAAAVGQGQGVASLWKPTTMVRFLGPFFALVGLYVLFHRQVVHDVYDWLPKGYEFNNPIEAVHSVAHGLTFWLTWWFHAGVEIIATGQTRLALFSWLNREPLTLPVLPYYLLPALFFAIAAVLRDRRLVFGLCWAVLAFFPANLIPVHTLRYYYGAIMGVALVYATLFIAADRAIARRWPFEVVAAARVIGSLLILTFVQTSIFYTTSVVGSDERACRRIEEVYYYLVGQRGRWPSKTLFQVRCLNDIDHFHYGMGLREMFKLALDDDEVEAIFPKQDLTTKTLSILLKEYPPPVELDVDRLGFKLTPTSLTPGTATAPPRPPESSKTVSPGRPKEG